MLQKLPKSTIALAVAAAIGAGATLTSPGVQAATLDNTDRLGDAAIFQYYSARDTWQTFFRLINTSADAVVVKVRFREAANSREVLDFFVALSPYDMWAGWTDKDALNNGSGPGIRTNDTSCIFPAPDTAPTFDGGFKTIDGDLKAALFKKTAFTGVYDDKAGLDPVVRMSEGHFEVIGVAQYSLDKGTAAELDFVNFVSHGTDGYPASCGAARNLFFAGQSEGSDGRPVGNVIGANAYMTNIGTGQGAGYDPDILRDCTSRSLRNEATATDTDPDLDSCEPNGFGTGPFALNQRLWDGTEPPTADTTTYQVDLSKDGTITNITRTVLVPGNPNCTTQNETNVDQVVYDAAVAGRLSRADPRTCDVDILPTVTGQAFITDTTTITGAPIPWRIKQKGIVGETPVTGGVDNVSAEFMRTSVISEWAASKNPAAVVKDYYTQWVLTFPTKHYYVDLQDDANLKDDISPTLVASETAGQAFAPFSNSFMQGPETNTGNEAGKSCEPFDMYMWNREERFAQYTSPNPYVDPKLCYETNVITFDQAYESRGLASKFSVTVPVELFPTEPDGSKSERGWAELVFTGPGSDTGLLEPVEINSVCAGSTGECPQKTTTLFGLPVTGFLFSVYDTGDVLTNMASINAHKYTRQDSMSPEGPPNDK
jgi:hypothetical protein